MSREVFILLCLIVTHIGVAGACYNIGVLRGGARARKAYQTSFRRILETRADPAVSSVQRRRRPRTSPAKSPAKGTGIKDR